MGRVIGAKIVNEKIIVVDGADNERITVKADKNVKLYINQEECEFNKEYKVTSDDEIYCKCIKSTMKRDVNIRISSDNMKAYITTNYTSEIEYKIKDSEADLNLVVSTEIVNQAEPEYYTISEIEQKLAEKGIIYGIKEQELENVIAGTEKEILIAEGKQPINDIPSEVKTFFTPTQKLLPELDFNGKVDYKNLFRISNVKVGEKIAEIIPEVIGENGINVFGQVVEREYIRSVPITVSEGCKIVGNDIFALINGKAHMTNNVISVNPIYTIESVNMETCNIKFNGDIEVYASVEDNMVVSAGGSLDVSQNVNAAKVVTGGEITILGNAINSRILSGQLNIRIKEYSNILIEFKDIIAKMINDISELKTKGSNLVKDNIIRALTERKYTNFQRIALNIITLNIKNKTKRSKLMQYIKDNVLGINIINMKSTHDLLRLSEMLENEIDYYEQNVIVPLDIRIGYSQDSEIKSTGSIIVGGRGAYKSKLTAMKDILFTRADSVVRGGVLSAEGNISAGIVGSKACIHTTLKVPLDGKISAALVYSNTILCFGNIKMTLEEEMRNVYAHYNEHGRRIEFSRA